MHGSARVSRRLSAAASVPCTSPLLAAAREAGLKIKINAVALKGVNDDELHDMVRWCGAGGYDLTFIEVMPMGDIGGESRLDQYLPLSLVRSTLAQRWTLEDIDHKTGGPARYTRCGETGGRIGFITPMTHNFCESCNRVRLTCTGGSTGEPTRLGWTRNDIDTYNEMGARALWTMGCRPDDFVISLFNYSMYAGGIMDHGGFETLGAGILAYGALIRDASAGT